MRFRSALLYMITGQTASLAVMAVGLAVLGRLLPPAAFGHFAVALAVYGMAEVVSQFGIRQLVISRHEAHTREEVASAAGLSLAIASVLCLCGLVAAVVLTGTPGTAAFGATLVPLSLALLVGPFMLSTEALLQRSMLFGLISFGSVARVTAEVAVSVSLALAGFGAAALAWGLFASQVTMALVVIAGGGPERRIMPRIGAWRGLMGWGERMTLIQILPRVSEIIALTSLSFLQGATAVGLFNRARTIHRLLDRTLLEGIKPVILPAFSDALRGGVDPAHLYRVKLDCMAAIVWPGFAVIAVMAEPLVAVLLGPGWDHIIPVVQILALMGIGMPVTKMSQKFFVALNETGTFLRIEAVREAVRVPLALAGALISLEAFALAYVAGNLMKASGVASYLHRRIGGPEGGYVPVARRAAIVTLLSVAGPASVGAAGLAAVPTLAAALPLAALGWLLGLRLTRHSMLPQIAAGLRSVRSRLRRGKP